MAARGTATAGRGRISWVRVVGLVVPGFVAADALLVGGALYFATRFFPEAGRALAIAGRHVIAPLVVIFVVLALAFWGLGSMFGLFSRQSLLWPGRAWAVAVRSLFWSGIVTIGFNLLLALDPPGTLNHVLLPHTLFLAVGVFSLRPLIARLLLSAAVVGSVTPRRMVIVGSTPEARRAAAALESGDLRGTEVIGLADLKQNHTTNGRRWPRFEIDGWHRLPKLAVSLAADEVLIASKAIDRADAVGIASELADAGIETGIVPHLTELYVDGAPTRRDTGVPLLRLGGGSQDALGLRLKALADFTVASGLGLALLPLLLLIALLVKATSRGPILYAQTRVGRDGKHFQMYKFRSMAASNDDSGHREYVASMLRKGHAAGTDPSGRPVYKILDDPRVTMIGRILRRTSLDELPQLINVLRGEMSLVGPRPCLPFEYELYEPWQRRRLDATPGMTGLWQVSGRNFLSFEEMVLLDLYYIANWSFLLDLKLLWRTIPEVLYSEGVR